MPLMDVLSTIHRFGRVRARRLCQTADVAENKRIGTLTDRQAALIAELLTDAERVG
jgi:ribosomal protein S13